MIWKTKDFIKQKSKIIKYFKKKGVTGDTVSEYCSLAGVPITVVCEFIKESLPEHTDFCNSKIKDINEFFGIK